MAEGAGRIVIQALVVVIDVEERTDRLRPDDLCMPQGERRDGDDPVDIERGKDTQ
jgi:hypothetical protein